MASNNDGTALAQLVATIHAAMDRAVTQNAAVGQLPEKDTELDNAWFHAIPRVLRDDLPRAVEYLCMLVAIDFRHWGEEGVEVEQAKKLLLAARCGTPSCDSRYPLCRDKPTEGFEAPRRALPGSVVRVVGFYASLLASAPAPPDIVAVSVYGSDSRGSPVSSPTLHVEVGRPHMLRGSAAMIHLLKQAVDVHGIHWYDTCFIRATLRPLLEESSVGTERGGRISVAHLTSAQCLVVMKLFLGTMGDGTTPMLMPAWEERIALLVGLADALNARDVTFYELLTRSRGVVLSDVRCADDPWGTVCGQVSERSSGRSGFLDALIELHPRYRDTCRLSGDAAWDGLGVGLLKLGQLTVIALQLAWPPLVQRRRMHKQPQGPLASVTTESLTLFTDIGQHVSICSDYQLPRALRAAGILQYSDQLARYVDTGTLLSEGSEEEIAIRVGSIVAAEQLREYALLCYQQAGKYGGQCSVLLLDYALWHFGRYHSAQLHHLCHTTMY